MSEVTTVIQSRIGKKATAIAADNQKISNLKTQIEMYQGSITKTEESRDQKQDEVDVLLDLLAEAQALIEKRNELQAYTDGLFAKFNAIEWRPDMPWEEKLESTDYAEKIAERQDINARLLEIEKTANKTYYRR